MTGRSICLIKESVVEMHGDDDGCGPGRMTGRMFILLSVLSWCPANHQPVNESAQVLACLLYGIVHWPGIWCFNHQRFLIPVGTTQPWSLGAHRAMT